MRSCGGVVVSYCSGVAGHKLGSTYRYLACREERERNELLIIGPNCTEHTVCMALRVEVGITVSCVIT